MKNFYLASYDLSRTEIVRSIFVSEYALRHIKQANQEVSWKGRTVHRLIATIEFIPFLGIIASLLERCFASCFHKKVETLVNKSIKLNENSPESIDVSKKAISKLPLIHPTEKNLPKVSQEPVKISISKPNKKEEELPKAVKKEIPPDTKNSQEIVKSETLTNQINSPLKNEQDQEKKETALSNAITKNVPKTISLSIEKYENEKQEDKEKKETALSDALTENVPKTISLSIEKCENEKQEDIEIDLNQLIENYTLVAAAEDYMKILDAIAPDTSSLRNISLLFHEMKVTGVLILHNQDLENPTKEEMLFFFSTLYQKKIDPFWIQVCCSNLARTEGLITANAFKNALQVMNNSPFHKLYNAPHHRVFLYTGVPLAYLLPKETRYYKEWIDIRKILCDPDDNAGFSHLARIKNELAVLGESNEYSNYLYGINSGHQLVAFLEYNKFKIHLVYQACLKLSNSPHQNISSVFKKVTHYCENSSLSAEYLAEESNSYSNLPEDTLSDLEDYGLWVENRYKDWIDISLVLTENEDESQNIADLFINEMTNLGVVYRQDYKAKDPDVMIVHLCNFTYQNDKNPNLIYQACERLFSRTNNQAFQRALNVMDNSIFSSIYKGTNLD